jgi:endonuclease/exonuclease/phosphatase family metal-dependent hydrolase
VRVATLNLWGIQGEWERRLDVAARGLAAASPDVVVVQEVHVAPDVPNTARQLAARLGPDWRTAYACATRLEKSEEGLAILARRDPEDERSIELPDAREGDRRILLSARVGDVWIHTTHLHYRLADGLARERQVVAIDAAVRQIGGEGVHILGGDLNAPPDADEIRFLAGRHTLGRRTYWQDAFRALHPDEPGVTWARRNPYTAPLAWLELDRRIDYLFVSPERRDGRGKIREARVILDEPDGDVWASDHFGVLADVAV